MKARKRRDFKKLDELMMNVQERACVRKTHKVTHKEKNTAEEVENTRNERPRNSQCERVWKEAEMGSVPAVSEQQRHGCISTRLAWMTATGRFVSILHDRQGLYWH